MKLFPKLLTAVCLLTIAGLVGCGSPKTPAEKTPAEKTPATKTPADHDHDHEHDHDEKTPDAKTPDAKTPAPTQPMPTTPEENPDVKTVPETPSPANAESGSTEKKGGVDIDKE